MTTNLEKRPKKAPSSPAFSLNVDGVKGVCPAGEKHAEMNIAEGKIPVLSCGVRFWLFLAVAVSHRIRLL